MKYGQVLLADSHREMLEGVRGLLAPIFGEVVTVSTEESLFEATRISMPDLAVVDLSIPCSTGINILHSFKRAHPDLKMIILSHHDEEMVVKECLKAGVRGYVLKRTAASDLIPAVDAVMGGDVFISPSIDGPYFP